MLKRRIVTLLFLFCLFLAGYSTETGTMSPDELQPAKPAVTEQDTGQYVGSINSDKYHKTNCRWAQNIKAENEIWFESKEEARVDGYVQC